MKLFRLCLSSLSVAICASAGTDDIAISLSLGLSERISAIEARQSKILEAIAAATNQEKSHWDELKLEMKQLLKQEKVDQPVDQSATTQVTIQATELPTTSLSSRDNDFVLIANSGKPGVSSYNTDSCAPWKGFAKWADFAGSINGRYSYCGDRHYWMSKNFQFPALIWMRFSKPHRLAKIGFSTPWERHSPRNIRFIGSDDCSHWTYLLNVTDAGFTRDFESKTWVIPSKNRKPFYCIGVSWPNRGKGDGYARISNLTMWEVL